MGIWWRGKTSDTPNSHLEKEGYQWLSECLGLFPNKGEIHSLSQSWTALAAWKKKF